ncbi:MAG: Golgin subfamily A member 7 [Paramarteilia canceri]
MSIRQTYRAEIPSIIKLEVWRVVDDASIRLFIPRDYSKGFDVQFLEDMPADLDKILERKVYAEIIHNINQLLVETEKVTVLNVIGGILNFFFCNIPSLFLPNPYIKILDRILDYIAKKNKETLNPVGVHMIDPMAYSMRLVI